MGASGSEGIAQIKWAGKLIVDDVQLGNQHVETEPANLCDESRQPGAVDLKLAAQMPLQADRVEWHVAVLQRADQVKESLSLASIAIADELDVIFVDHELRQWVDRGGRP